MGTVAAAVHHGLTAPTGATTLLKGGWLGAVLRHYPSEMAQNFWTAICAWTTCFVLTIALSLVTRRNRTDEELKGLVYSLTPRIEEAAGTAWWQRPSTFAIVVLVLVLCLNILFR